MALAGLAFCSGCGAQQESPRGAEDHPPVPSALRSQDLPPDLAEVHARACVNAAEADDPTPDLIEVVPTTEREALRVAFDSTQAKSLPNRPVWLVQVRGDFVALTAPGLPGAEPPRGSIMRFTAQRGPDPPGGSSWGLSNAERDLSQLGVVTKLPQDREHAPRRPTFATA